MVGHALSSLECGLLMHGAPCTVSSSVFITDGLGMKHGAVSAAHCTYFGKAIRFHTTYFNLTACSIYVLIGQPLREGHVKGHPSKHPQFNIRALPWHAVMDIFLLVWDTCQVCRVSGVGEGGCTTCQPETVFKINA